MTQAETTDTACPFCRVNGLLRGDVLAETAGAYLLRGTFGSNTYLIIPEQHYEALADLPDDWWRDVKAMLARVPELPANYNISVNYGPEAGQSVKHLHFWVIPRTAGKASSGKGFARLIAEADEA